MSDEPKKDVPPQQPSADAGKPAEKIGVYEQAKNKQFLAEELKPHKDAYTAANEAAKNATPDGKQAAEKAAATAKENLVKAGGENWDKAKLGWVDSAKARVGGVFGGKVTGMKVARGAAALGAAVYAGKKGLEVFSPERDDKGERKESLVVTVGKATAALAAVGALVLAGGKNKAMGI